MGQRAIAKRLAEYFRTQAEFRGAKAEHYPDDPRNEKAMTALCALADWANDCDFVTALDAVEAGES